MARKKKDKSPQEEKMEKVNPTAEKPEDPKKAAEDKDDIPVWEDRSKDWSDDEDVKDQISDVYSLVEGGYGDKTEQNSDLKRFWDVYNCETNENQAYDGDSKVYLPMVRDAIEARVTRFTNMLFPQTGRYTEVISDDGDTPYETMAMLDYYVGAARLRDVIVPSLMRSGDITGQYSVYISWCKRKRHTVQRKMTPILGPEETGAGEVPQAGSVEDIEIEKFSDDVPDVMVLDARDLLVLPANVDEIADADIVAIALRMTKSKIRELIEDGTFREDEGEMLIDNMSMGSKTQQPDPDKQNLSTAGVKTDAKGNRTALVYQVWKKLKIGGKRRMCVTHFGGPDLVLGCKRNPNWNDRVPVLSRAALKVNGSFWGKSRVEAVERSQYAANDAVNMGLDSAKYSLMPIVMSDPEKNPRSGTMVMAMAAMWQVDPNSTKVVQFPQLWKEAIQLVELCGAQIDKSLGVNPAMIPQGSSSKKPSQAQVAQEQQVALESTADVVTILESSILNELITWFYELDYQHRDKALRVKQFGPVGNQSIMQEVPLIQVGKHYAFKWYGTEGFRSAQQIQQQMAMLNVIRNIPPEMLNGRKLDAGPLLEQAALSAFGPNLAPKILIDQRHQLTMPPQIENEMLLENFDVKVQPMDNDQQHLQAHQAAMQVVGDPSGLLRNHIMAHVQQMYQKQAGQQQAQQGGQAPGPRPGAVPQAPTGAQNPAGAIHPDQMKDPGMMPRK